MKATILYISCAPGHKSSARFVYCYDPGYFTSKSVADTLWMYPLRCRMQKMQEIIYQGRDTAHMLASLYAQKEGSSGPWGFGMREIKGRSASCV